MVFIVDSQYLRYRFQSPVHESMNRLSGFSMSDLMCTTRPLACRNSIFRSKPTSNIKQLTNNCL